MTKAPKASPSDWSIQLLPAPNGCKVDARVRRDGSCTLDVPQGLLLRLTASSLDGLRVAYASYLTQCSFSVSRAFDSFDSAATVNVRINDKPYMFGLRDFLAAVTGGEISAANDRHRDMIAALLASGDIVELPAEEAKQQSKQQPPVVEAATEAAAQK